jgi:iron complex outermembrane receptor protein
VRIAGFYDDRDGYNKHPAGGGFFVFPAYAAGRSDDNHSVGGRVSLRLDPSDALSVNLAFEYADRKFTPGIFATGDMNAPGNGPSATACDNGYTRVAPAYAPQLLCVPSNTNLLGAINRNNYTAPLYGLSRVGDKTWAARARVAYQFSDAATLTYTGGYRNYKGDPNSVRTLPIIYRSYQFEDVADAQSHELRLNGEMGGVIYQVGAFYFKEKQRRESGFMLPSFVFGLPPFGPTGPTPGTFISYFGRNVDTESKSLFGQADIPLADKWTAVVGLRHTDNKRTGLYLNGTPFGRFGPDFGLLGAGSARKNFATLQYVSTLHLGSNENKLTWLAGLNYKPNDNTLIYGKVSTGFKGGGFDSVGDYKPETNTALEVGLKQTFGSEGQHSFEISAFHYDYKDLQVSVLLDTVVGGQTFNAGKAKNWGVEAAGTFHLTDADTVRVSANYLNAKFKELFAQFNVVCVGCGLNGIGDLDPVTPGVQQPNFAGNTPAFSPEFVGVLAYDHVFSLGGAGSLTARGSLTTKSSYFTDFYNYADGKQAAYTTYDVSLDYAPTNGKWGVQLYGRNLGNERPLTYGGFTSAGPDDVFNWQFGAPRTYGVRFNVEF